jgi:hypothetical protein
VCRELNQRHLLHESFDQMSFVDQQILKRLYWLIFADQCICDIHGRHLLILRHAHEACGHLLPFEITDDHLLGGADASLIEGTT